MNKGRNELRQEMGASSSFRVAIPVALPTLRDPEVREATRNDGAEGAQENTTAGESEVDLGLGLYEEVN